MVTKPPAKQRRSRGAAIPVRLWWYDTFLIRAKGKDDTLVAEMVSNASATPDERWDRSETGKIRKGTYPITLQFALAASRAFVITPPIYLPRTEAEALEMLAVQQKYDRLQPPPVVPPTAAVVHERVVQELGGEGAARKTTEAAAKLALKKAETSAAAGNRRDRAAHKRAAHDRDRKDDE